MLSYSAIRPIRTKYSTNGVHCTHPGEEGQFTAGATSTPAGGRYRRSFNHLHHHHKQQGGGVCGREDPFRPLPNENEIRSLQCNYLLTNIPARATANSNEQGSMTQTDKRAKPCAVINAIRRIQLGFLKMWRSCVYSGQEWSRRERALKAFTSQTNNSSQLLRYFLLLPRDALRCSAGTPSSPVPTPED